MSGRRSEFGVNTYSYTLTHTAAECIAHLASQGVAHLELMAYPGHLWPSELDAASRRSLRKQLDACGVRLLSLNMPSLDVNFAAASMEMRRYSVDLLSGLVELAGDLGAAHVLIAPGKANPLFPPPREQLVGRFHAALDALLPLARRAGTGILVENVPICFVPDATGLMGLLQTYGADDIHIVYDVANAYYIGEDLAEGLHAVSERLRLVHLSDTGRTAWKHDPIGEGAIPFADLPALLREVGYAEIPILEIISRDADSGIFGSMDRLLGMGWGA
jgi:sugar phosphate isomerase/epimerase